MVSPASTLRLPMSPAMHHIKVGLPKFILVKKVTDPTAPKFAAFSEPSCLASAPYRVSRSTSSGLVWIEPSPDPVQLA